MYAPKTLILSASLREDKFGAANVDRRMAWAVGVGMESSRCDFKTFEKIARQWRGQPHLL